MPNKKKRYIVKNNIRDLRIKKGFTQKRLARLMGLDDAQSIQPLEYGLVEPKIVNVLLLAKVLETPVEKIFRLVKIK